MPEIEMYCSNYCGYCSRAEMLLRAKGVQVTKLFVDRDRALLQQMLARSNGRTSVPQIFIDNQHVGGFDDLAALERDGRLDPMLGL